MGHQLGLGDRVTDKEGTQFLLKTEIASRGQGTVFTTQLEGVAVKVLHRSRSGPSLEQRLREVARLPITDLPVAYPRSTLAPPTVGYTMSLLTGMISLDYLVDPAVPGDRAGWITQTGGLRKRLAVIEHLSESIAALHARGLVYSDLSGSNVLTSQNPGHTRTYLIDLDNLQTTDKDPLVIFTAPFAAPEQEAGATQGTDRFSLAVIVWALLTMQYPHYGSIFDARHPDEIPHGEPWAKLVPWVDDPSRTENRPLGVLPRDKVLSPRLRRALHRAFTDGAQNVDQRPPANTWAQLARSARMALGTCHVCNWHNYATATRCAYCDEQLRHCGVRIWADMGNLRRPYSWTPMVLTDDEPTNVAAITLGVTDGPQDPVLTIAREGPGVLVTLLRNDLSFAEHPFERQQLLRVGEPLEIQRDKRRPLHFVALGSQP